MPVKRYNGTDWVTVAGDGGQGPAGNDGTAPLSTKGDLLTRTTSAVTNLGVGANDTVLTADSSTATGLKWATPAAGGMTLLSTTTLSGASTTISSISQSYTSLFGVIYGVTNATANGFMVIKPLGNNNVATTTTEAGGINSNASIWYLDSAVTLLRTSDLNAWFFNIYNYTSTTYYKPLDFGGSYLDSTSIRRMVSGGGAIKETGAITSLTFLNDGGNFSTGTVLLYGVK